MQDSFTHCEIVEVELQTGKLSYNFGRQRVLTGKQIVGIVVDSAGSLSQAGNTLQDPVNAYMTFRTQSNHNIMEIQARRFLATDGTPLLQVLPIDLRDIDWEKSLLQFAPGSTIAADSSFQMTVFYRNPSAYR